MILWKLKKFYSKYLLTILFLWLLSFIIISCSKPANRVKNENKKYLELISLGDVERDEGNYKNAEKYYEEAKKYLLKAEDGNDSEGIYYLMTIYYREKMFGKNKMNGIDDEIMLKIDLMLGNENENKKFELIDEADSLIRK